MTIFYKCHLVYEATKVGQNRAEVAYAAWAC